MRIGIMPNREKDGDLAVTRKLVNTLNALNCVPSLEKDLALRLCGADVLPVDDVFTCSDVVVVIGGDGTMLSAARRACRTGAAIMGVNIGHLGFLTEVEVSEMEPSMKALLSGEYREEARMLLSVSVEGKPELSGTALNDVSINRTFDARLLYIEAEVSGQAIGVFSADGVVISTPTGSTAYSLSAGGPVICPEMECLLFTPICAHTLHMRPIVVPPDGEVSICAENRDADISLMLDGQVAMRLSSGDRVKVAKADRSVRFIHVKPRDFFTLMRKKFME